jgi:hypothetical protein
MPRQAALLWIACALLAGCHGEGSPYRQAGNPAGQNPNGTPADRTGGARNVPDGQGPVTNPTKTAPASNKR